MMKFDSAIAKFAMLVLGACLASCATTNEGETLQPRQVTECPGSMILICEGNNKPSSGGDEETPAYERCFCRSRY